MKKFLFSVIVFAISSSAFSADVKVLGGRGLVGVYNNYIYKENSAVTWSGALIGGRYDPYPYVTLTNYMSGYHVCSKQYTMEIDGVWGIPISSDLMLVPDLTFRDRRTLNRYLPELNTPIDVITGYFNGSGSGTNEYTGNPERDLCPWRPQQSSPVNEMLHNVTVQGRFLIYGTGNQKSGRYNLQYSIGFGIKDHRFESDYKTWTPLISSGPINVVVSGLTCSLQTDSKVNFETQDGNATANTKLATIKKPMSIYCSQLKNETNASIGIAAEVPTQYKAGSNYDVNLLDSSNRAAAYVKVFLLNNGNKQAIPLNGSMISLASITTSQKELYVNTTLEYELYSRGIGSSGKVRGAYQLSAVMR
ncbi:hypothetical protein [Providencia rettgeri]|uniref:hypothetical protein n=1 Tax=Providencia rettgeri TaxID=587 RepID=UPI0034E0B06F